MGRRAVQMDNRLLQVTGTTSITSGQASTKNHHKSSASRCGEFCNNVNLVIMSLLMEESKTTI